MTAFRCIPMPSETANRWRASSQDDRGNALLRRTVAPDALAPCRHCLRDALPGEEVYLGSYNLPAPTGVYWTPSPVWLHVEPCEAYSGTDHVAEIVRPRLVSVRAYDADQMCLYDLGHAGDGTAVDAPLVAALADPRTAFVNIHTAKPGCLLCRVERA